MDTIKYVIANGVKINGFQSKDELISYAFERKGILVAVNAEKICYATDKTREIINNNISYADGVGAVMCLKRQSLKNVVKISGCELWLNIVEKFHKEHTFYLIGGVDEVIDATIEKLQKNFSNIKILGYRNGYLRTNEEKELLINDIAEKQPDFVFVAIGSPKQEMLMQEMLNRHKAVYQGLGGSFDVYVGIIKRAPKYFIIHNLEWFYRLLRQPVRIKRQWIFLKFVILLMFNKF
jgi:UDP-N-acetyl-D-mannosaminouronate:lipid I N-acetyl-D-mannosaminouronosyltransferase